MYYFINQSLIGQLELDKIMCEDRDKELGVKPSDYTFCDVPADTEDNHILGTAEEVDLNRMASVGFNCLFKIGDGAHILLTRSSVLITLLIFNVTDKTKVL